MMMLGNIFAGFPISIMTNWVIVKNVQLIVVLEYDYNLHNNVSNQQSHILK